MKMSPMQCYLVVVLYFAFCIYQVDSFDSIRYSCWTRDGTLHKSCTYWSLTSITDINSVIVGCCLELNSTDHITDLSCMSRFGPRCSDANAIFFPVDKDSDETPPPATSRPRTTLSTSTKPTTPTTTPYNPVNQRFTTRYYYRRPSTTSYRYNRSWRTTNSYRYRYIRSTSRPYTYTSTSSTSTYRILKIVGGVFSVVVLIAGIAGYCSKKNRNHDDVDLPDESPVYFRPTAIPMPAPDSSSGGFHEPDTAAGEDDQYAVPSYKTATDSPASYPLLSASNRLYDHPNVSDGDQPEVMIVAENLDQDITPSDPLMNPDQSTIPHSEGHSSANPDDYPNIAPPSYHEAIH